jgi:hypothetical protein
MSTHNNTTPRPSMWGYTPYNHHTHRPAASCARAGMVLAMDQWMVGVVTVR